MEWRILKKWFLDKCDTKVIRNHTKNAKTAVIAREGTPDRGNPATFSTDDGIAASSRVRDSSQ